MAMERTAPATPTTVEQRRDKVAELSRGGKSEREIAKELGVSRTTVWTDKQVIAGKA